MDATVNEAALLLQQVAQLASKELSQQGGGRRQRVEIISPRESFESWSTSDESDSSPPESPTPVSPSFSPLDSPSESPNYRQGRFRAVSVSSLSTASPGLGALLVDGLGAAPLPPPPLTLQSRMMWLQSSSPASSLPLMALARPPIFPELSKLCPIGLRHVKHVAPKPTSKLSRKSKYVGMHTPRKQVKGILQRKFTWKNYPELEDFLIDKREEYLRHSSMHNYTSTQKEFNNELTNQLLNLAASSGYIFDRFLYVEVRDRIRCYYKSYLQSLKQKS